MENDTKRLEMFRKYYRNTTINEGLFVSQKQRKKLVIHNFKVALQKLLKGDSLEPWILLLREKSLRNILRMNCLCKNNVVAISNAKEGKLNGDISSCVWTVYALHLFS